MIYFIYLFPFKSLILGKIDPEKRKFAIHFDTQQSLVYTVTISDPTVMNSFQKPTAWSSGERIDIDTSKPLTIDYGIQLTEVINSAEDGSCDNYPKDKFQDYARCVEAEIYNKVEPALGCTIPWISVEKACQKPVERTPAGVTLMEWAHDTVDDAFGGTQYRSENCKEPCGAYATEATKHAVSTSVNNQTLLFLHIKRHVKVKQIVLSYDNTSLVVEIGSCLGMWLGLSVVGMFDIAVIAIGWVNKMFSP